MSIAIDLSGQIAVITGAARGLGAATAERLAVAGATVIIADIDLEAATATATAVAAASGASAHSTWLDVIDSAVVSATFDEIQERFGPVSLLVNNAGILHNAPFREVSVEHWDLMLDTHLRGAALCSQAALDGLIKTRGAIVNLSSGAAMGSPRGQASYSAAKAGVIGLTRTLAIELGPLGIRVNAVAPGAIASEMTRATAAQDGVSFEEYCTGIAARVPLGRIGHPSDVADVICFLASDLSRYVTGETIFVSGGPGGRL
ncbi:3-oxoacyl-ACP reductase FabG [soil metagenome]